MKFALKIFFCTVMVVAVLFSLCGYLLIAQSFQTDIERETARSLDEYQMAKFVFESELVNVEMRHNKIDTKTLSTAGQQTMGALPAGYAFEVFDSEGVQVYPESLREDGGFSKIISLSSTQQNQKAYAIVNEKGRHKVQVGSMFLFQEKPIYIYTQRDIQEIFERKDKQVSLFITLDIVLILVASAVMFALSVLLTKPINTLKRSAHYIAEGDFSHRANVQTEDEIGELATSFNYMAHSVEKNVEDLERYIQQREDFVANFAHELKTPLTSIIGYADMMRSKILPEEVAFQASTFIFNEGKRLESLSIKLMELLVLEKQDFLLQKSSARLIFQHTSAAVLPLLEQYHIELELIAKDQIVLVEKDLVETLIINLIDNARKASEGGKIQLMGQTIGNRYVISVKDFGTGIEENELARITEAFYMVDKSRAREQHGAGIGLALCKQIAEIHGSNLHFESQMRQGTTVCFSVPIFEREGQN